MYHYSVPPPGYVRYNYTTSADTSPSSSPPPYPTYAYYIPPQYKSPTTSPKAPKRHSRKASYNSPQVPGGWHSPAGYPQPTNIYTTTARPDHASPAIYQDYVSKFGHVKPKARRFSTSDARGGGNVSGHKRHASVQSQNQRIIVDTSDEADDSPTFSYIKPKAAHKPEKYAKPKANQYFSSKQASAYAKPSDSQPVRPRRASQSKPTTTKPAKAAPPPREATAADAADHHIPAGYSLKNWDPTESPILLLGSVFDANSLGKWIYDWTVFYHGADSPMSEIAGDLWLLLIKLAHKMKRADKILPQVRSEDNQDMLEDFLESGERLWGKFKLVLKVCEDYMYKVVKKAGAKGSTRMGTNSGVEFVKAMFGRDRKLADTESLMQSMRLWNLRFDSNCEEIIRYPSAH